MREGLDVRDGSKLSGMDVYGDGRIRCIRTYSDSKENKWQGPALGARSCHLRFTPKERS